MRRTKAQFSTWSVKWIIGILLLSVAAIQAQTALDPHSVPDRKTRNVIIVMLDGLRWKEVFQGADSKLINRHSPRMLGSSTQRTRQAKELYWRETPAERREALMPFLWDVIAVQGQVFGNRKLGSDSHVTNGLKFSYPGYNETLTGAPDDKRIHSNRNISNPNVTVLEWLNEKPAYHGKVAAFGAWQVFQGIFNAERCGFVVNTAYDPLTEVPPTPELALLNTLREKTPHIWSDESFDALPFYTAVEYLKLKKPSVLFIGLGETDDWAHMGAYPEYLNSAHRDDEYLRELWTLLQTMPEYKDQTTLIVLSDHGRGSGFFWRLHAWPVPGSGQTWMAFLGPDTPALGERQMVHPVTESEIAATVATFLGENYNSEMARAGQPILDVLPPQTEPAEASAITSADSQVANVIEH